MSNLQSTNAYLPSPYQQQIHQSKYARWNEDAGRRETWTETVDRYVDFMKYYLAKHHNPLSDKDYTDIRNAILIQDVLPSMRALMTAGPALERDEVAGYNCSYIAVNRQAAFDEAMYILMCGTGVGFSVETKHTDKLPVIPEKIHKCDDTIVVADSKVGWASAYRRLIALLYSGSEPTWDTSKVRPAGARLKTFGGRASGPGPLEELFEYTVGTFKGAEGRRLNSVECHSLMCKVGDIVVVGGVRRSALISLSDPSDGRMRDIKQGQWWELEPHYALANNSAVWTDRPDAETFIDEWSALIRSKSGERGIFNRKAAQAKVASIGRDADHEFGLNPCGEIILRDRQFCNLSQITVRPEDTRETLMEKVRIASIIGTMQSSMTKFRYLSAQWRKNCEEERLLGVGMTGVMDNDLLNGSWASDGLADLLAELREEVAITNVEYAKKIGIDPSKAATCMKPAGNSTQLVGVHGSGIHEAYAKHYIRRNRANKNDPVAQLLYYQGVPCEDEIAHPDTTWVFSYPMKAPDTAIVRSDRTAIQRLEHWLIFAEHWCDHNPSITINVEDHEWMEVGAWVYKHFDKMIGVTFLPSSNHTYKQAPYEEIDEDAYKALLAEMPTNIDWELLTSIETSDQTEGVQELSCTAAGGCEI